MGSCVVTSDKCPISGLVIMVRTMVVVFIPLLASAFAKSIVSDIQVQSLVQTKTHTTEASTEYKSYNENLHYNENPTNYPAAKILNLLQSFSFIPGFFSSEISSSSNETLDKSGNNNTDYQYH